jgi:DNA-binding response OmpR family regulator
MVPACAPQPAAVAPRVLIVDDTADDREMYSLFLTTIGGCQVTTAASGRAALQLLARDRPDVVVLDARLPDLDGAEVCRQFRTSPESERTAVVAVTALPLRCPEVEGLINAGTNVVLQKPCPPEMLLKEIRALTAQSQALRERGPLPRHRVAGLRAASDRLHQQSSEATRLARELLDRAEYLSLTQRAKANYLDLPGLSLTLSQASRLWGFDEATCKRALDALASEGFLIRSLDGQYRQRPQN